jgi:hypothetical protein
VFDLLQESLNNYHGPFTPAQISGFMADLIHDLRAHRNSEDDVRSVERWKKQFETTVSQRHIQSVSLRTLTTTCLLVNLNNLCLKWKGVRAMEDALRDRFRAALAEHLDAGGAAEHISRKMSLGEYHALQADPALRNDHRFCMDKYKWIHNEGDGPNPRVLRGTSPTHYAIWKLQRGTLAALASISLDENSEVRKKGGNDAPVLTKLSNEAGAFGIHEALLDLFNPRCVVRMVASGELDGEHNIPKSARTTALKK